MTEANLDAALEMANKWREVSGQEILSAWIPSIPRAGSYCLLAQAFNKNCTVGYSARSGPDVLLGSAGAYGRRMISGTGYVHFCRNADSREQAKEDAALFADTFGLEMSGEFSVTLPDEIALVAWEFDNGAYSEFVDEGAKE